MVGGEPSNDEPATDGKHSVFGTRGIIGRISLGKATVDGSSRGETA